MILENVSKKLQIYLIENQLSILKLSKCIPNIKYQTLKRIAEFDGKSASPNITSLVALADFFKCSVAELLDDTLILFIDCFSSVKEFCNNQNSQRIKLKIPIKQYDPNKVKTIFSLHINESFESSRNIIPVENIVQKIHVFVKMSRVEYDGYYIAEIDNITQIIKVVSVSSHTLMIEQHGKILSFDILKVKIIAKFINNGIMITEPENLFIAYKI